ncbi:MAG: VCBS repeat-containing protein [Nannocystales bacterium]
MLTWSVQRFLCFSCSARRAHETKAGEGNGRNAFVAASLFAAALLSLSGCYADPDPTDDGLLGERSRGHLGLVAFGGGPMHSVLADEPWELGASPTVGFPVILGDIDGDGFADLAAIDSHEDGMGAASSRATLSVHLGAPGGPTTESVQQIEYEPNSSSPRLFAAGDVDGDGLADALVYAGAPVSLRLHRGSAVGLETTEVWSRPRDGASRLPATGDLDGDGDVDIAVVGSSGGPSSLEVFIQDGGTLPDTADIVVEASNEQWGVPFTAPDIEGDGSAELFVLARGAGGASWVNLVRWSGMPSAGPAAPDQVISLDELAGEPLPRLAEIVGLLDHQVAIAADFDGDGRGDVAVPLWREEAPAEMLVLYGGADGLSGGRSWRFVSPTGPTGNAYSYFGRSSAAGDLNGDGIADLAVSTAPLLSPVGLERTFIFVFPGSPDGLASSPSDVIPGGWVNSELVHMGLGGLNDTNGDGFADVPGRRRERIGTDWVTVGFDVYPGQAEVDACTADSDHDAVCDDEDDCPETFNPTQADFDGDGVGDACDPNPGGPNPETGGETSTGALDGTTGEDGVGTTTGVENTEGSTTSAADVETDLGGTDTGGFAGGAADSGCGCSAGNDGGASFFALMLLVLVRARRRSRTLLGVLGAVLTLTSGCGDSRRPPQMAPVAAPLDDEGDEDTSDDEFNDTGGLRLDLAGGTIDPTDPTAAGDGVRGCSRVDFLFVIDNSGSMRDFQENLIASFPDFIQAIEEQVEITNYHIMVTDLDGWGYDYCESGCESLGYCEGAPEYGCGVTIPASPCEAVVGAGVIEPVGRDTTGLPCPIFTSDRRYLDHTQPDLEDAFACVAQVGTAGPGTEESLDRMIDALGDEGTSAGECNAGFLRDDAILVVTLITDEDNAEGVNGATAIEAVVDAKGGDQEAIVALGVISQSVSLEQFVNHFGDNALLGDIRAESYAPFFEEAVSIIDRVCDDFIPEG